MLESCWCHGLHPWIALPGYNPGGEDLELDGYQYTSEYVDLRDLVTLGGVTALHSPVDTSRRAQCA